MIDLSRVAATVAAGHGIDFDQLWWIDRPDRAVVTAGAPADEMADAIVQASGAERYDNHVVTVLDQDFPRAVRAGRLLAIDAEGTDVVLSSQEPIGATCTLVCTDAELIELICAQRGNAFTYEAVNGLYERSPEHSARYVLSRYQIWFGAAGLLGLVAGLWLAPTPSAAVLLGLTNLFLFCAVLFKVVAVLAGIVRDEPGSDEVERPTNDQDIPYYTVLAPVFREPEVVKSLAASLSQLDYPLDRVEILLLIEEEDTETPAALGADIPGNLFPIIVPASQPQTKPKACNWALNFARGEHLVIYLSLIHI